MCHSFDGLCMSISKNKGTALSSDLLAIPAFRPYFRKITSQHSYIHTQIETQSRACVLELKQHIQIYACPLRDHVYSLLGPNGH